MGNQWVSALTGFCRTAAGRRLLICLLLAVVTLLPYLQVRDHSFITFDDDQYVTANPMVLAGLTREGVIQAFTTFQAGNWHPLTWLSLMLDSQLYGVNPGAMHLTNVGFHIANTILLFLFLAGATGALGPSALVAALFALHPLHVESVAWVSERKDVLSTFFWLATMGAYAWYVSAPAIRRYLAVMVLFALGLMAKPMLVTLPFVLLLLDYWPLGRMQTGTIPGTGREIKMIVHRLKQVYWPLVKEKIPLLVLAAASCLVTMLAQEGGGTVMPLAIRPLAARIASSLVAYANYLVKLFWPYPMIFFYPLAPVPWWEAAWAGLLLIVLTVVLLYWGRRHPYLRVGWLWYLGTLVPVIGLVQVGGQAMADRYTYVPLIGLFLIVTWGACEATAGLRYRKIIGSAGAAALLLACLLSSWGQAGYWRNSETLFIHAININPNNYMAFNELGRAFTNEGKLDQAIAMFQKSIEVDPSYPNAYNNLGVVYARQGRLKEAVADFKIAVQLKTTDASFCRNLALAYRQQGKKSAAKAVMEKLKWLTERKK
jgi:tetratricopeptide (TPR) repeat protein